MKTQEELNALKAECEALNAKLAELTGEELSHAAGGGMLILLGDHCIVHGREFSWDCPAACSELQTRTDMNSETWTCNSLHLTITRFRS